MFDLTRTDSSRIDIGNLTGYVLDMAFGADENDFELSVGTDNPATLEKGCLIYSVGTDYGGMVTGMRVDTESGIVTYKGRTWHGLMEGNTICPPENETHLSVSGDANEVIAAVIEHLGIGDIFAASSESSGINVSGEFRFQKAYSALAGLLAKYGAKMVIEWDGNRAVIRAEQIVDYSNDSDRDNFISEVNYVPVNHLICLGIGEMLERVVIHLYADKDGNVSQTQSIFGMYHNSDIYEESNSEYDELLEKGIEKLTELQSTDRAEISASDSVRYDIGDIISAFDSRTGMIASAAVTKKIVTVQNGEADVSYEVGDVSVSR